MVEESGELAGADHRGFVDDEHRRVVECHNVSADAGNEPVDRRRRDAGVDLELLGGTGGEGAAEHPISRRGPRLAGGGEREGLPRTGDTFDDLDPVTRRADRLHHLCLLVGEGCPRVEGGLDRGVVGDAGAVATPVERCGEEAGLGVEHLRGGPPVLVGPGCDRGPVAAVHNGCPVVDPNGQHVFGAEEPVDEVQYLIDPTTTWEQVADRFDHIPLTERAHRGGQPVRRRQPPVELFGLGAPRSRRLWCRRAIQNLGEGLIVETEGFSGVTPAGTSAASGPAVLARRVA